MRLDKYSLVVFDWDGTLMDSTGRIVATMQAAAVELDFDRPSEQAVKNIIGLSMPIVVTTLFPNTNDAQVQQFIDSYRRHFSLNKHIASPLFNGVVELLKYLKANGKKLAIATGKSRRGLSNALGGVQLNDYFDFSICADESESKPSPQMLFHLIQESKLSHETMLMIGDSRFDLLMAKNANIDSIGVTCGANDYQQLKGCEPVAILNNVAELECWFSKTLAQ